jgi:hypothetical protein
MCDAHESCMFPTWRVWRHMSTVCEISNAYTTNTEVGKSEKVPIRVEGHPEDGRDDLQIMWTARLDTGRWITQVTGPTEVAVCEVVVITRIQSTPKSFRVDTVDVVALQSKVKHLENCTAQDSSKNSPVCLETRCTYPSCLRALSPGGVRSEVCERGSKTHASE